MDELIFKQTAIDALWKALYEYEDKTEKQFQESEELDVADWFQHRIFVQNMSDIDRQTILNLPSAQPDLDEFCFTCKEYDQERHCCPRWNRVIRNTIEEIKNAQSEPRWIPVEERLPEYGESVLCYYKDDDYGVNHIIDDEDGEWFNDGVIAWMPLPQPYERSEE